jgi:hypothetical protein
MVFQSEQRAGMECGAGDTPGAENQTDTRRWCIQSRFAHALFRTHVVCPESADALDVATQ